MQLKYRCDTDLMHNAMHLCLMQIDACLIQILHPHAYDLMPMSGRFDAEFLIQIDEDSVHIRLKEIQG